MKIYAVIERECFYRPMTDDFINSTTYCRGVFSDKEKALKEAEWAMKWLSIDRVYLKDVNGTTTILMSSDSDDYGCDEDDVLDMESVYYNWLEIIEEEVR